MTIDRWIIDAARTAPDKAALIFDETTITYAEFSAQINQRVGGLTAKGITRGDRVAWYGLNHSEVFVLLFACARIGAILVPLNWRLAPGEIAAIVDNCAPKLVIHDMHFADAARALPGVAHLPAGAPTGPNTTVSAEITDPILLVYTSGSTGRPKGVVLTQSALIANAEMAIDAHAMTSDDRVLNVLPLFHVGGLNILATPAFSLGATVVLHDRFDPPRCLHALQHATLAITVPTILQALIDLPDWPTTTLSGLRALSIGSTDVPRDLIDHVQARGIPLLQIYGATETSPYAIYQRAHDAIATSGSLGRAGIKCQIKLMRPDGVETGLSEPGEIWVKGDNVLTEYWKDPDQTRDMIVDRWFRTGDVATRDESGLYWFKDRIKHVIISGGENIYPAEIERVLRTHPDITETAVVGRADPKWGEVPVAVIVASAPLTRDQITDYLRDRIARFKQPKDVVFTDALPRNAMGKVVADQVRAMIGQIA